MDFGLQPPAGFELGHTQEYYETKLPRFHVADEPWGKTFTGGIVESFGQFGTVSGEFDGDVVTGLAIGISEDSTLCGIPLFQPLDRLANQLEHAGLEVVKVVAEDEEYTQMRIASPGLTFYVIADKGQPSALYWLKPSPADVQPLLSTTSAVNDLVEFLAHNGWKPAGEHALMLAGPHLTTRLELSHPRLRASNEGESVVAHFSLINPALINTTNDGAIYSGAPHTLINAAVIGKASNAFTTAIQLTIDDTPYTERYAQLHHDLKTFTDNITAAWVAQCIPVAERREGNQPNTDAANLVTTLRAAGHAHLAAEVFDEFAGYTRMGMPVPTHTVALYIPSDDIEDDTIFTIVDAGLDVGSGTDPRLIEYKDICDLLDEFTNVRLRSPRLLTVEIPWHKPMPEELLNSAARDGLGVCNLTTGDYYLAGDEAARFTSEITHRLECASPTIAIRALGRIERESIITAGEPYTAIFLLDDLTADALGISYSFTRRTFTVDYRNIDHRDERIIGFDCGRTEAAQLIELFHTHHRK